VCNLGSFCLQEISVYLLDVGPKMTLFHESAAKTLSNVLLSKVGYWYNLHFHQLRSPLTECCELSVASFASLVWPHLRLTVKGPQIINKGSHEAALVTYGTTGE